MRTVTHLLPSIAALAATVAACACTQPDCVIPPCPLPVAIVVNVTSAEGGPIAGVSITWSGSASGSSPCVPRSTFTQCKVLGSIGIYNIRIAATGFQAVMQSVTVDGSTQPCKCSTVQTQTLDVVLTPSALVAAQRR